MSGGGLGYGLESQDCCEPKVDIITLLATIGAIGAVSAFLRQAVIDYKIKGARSFKNEPFGKRFLTEHTLVDAILIGMFSNSFYSNVHVLLIVICLLNI